MSLVAQVKYATGATRHRVVTPDGLVNLPTAVRVRIAEDAIGVFLFRFDETGEMVADTWHQTVDEAKDQAKFEYLIEDADWSVATDPNHNSPDNPGAVTSI